MSSAIRSSLETSRALLAARSHAVFASRPSLASAARSLDREITRLLLERGTPFGSTIFLDPLATPPASRPAFVRDFTALLTRPEHAGGYGLGVAQCYWARDSVVVVLCPPGEEPSLGARKQGVKAFDALPDREKVAFLYGAASDQHVIDQVRTNPRVASVADLGRRLDDILSPAQQRAFRKLMSHTHDEVSLSEFRCASTGERLAWGIVRTVRPFPFVEHQFDILERGTMRVIGTPQAR